MSTVIFPKEYNQLMPYLIIERASDFITFVETVFSAVTIMKHMRDEHTIMHAEVKIGECVIMFSDSTDQYPVRNTGLFIYVANAEETYDKAIKGGATVITPLAEQPYGITGGITDPFGNTWWITQHVSA